MTKQQFINQFGEDPIDMFGPNWRDYLRNRKPRGF